MLVVVVLFLHEHHNRGVLPIRPPGSGQGTQSGQADRELG